MPDDFAPTPAPGWYPHPALIGSELYWDGSAWTDRSRPAVPPAQAGSVPVYGTPAGGGPSRPAPAAYGTDPGSNPYAVPARTGAAGRNPMATASLVLGILSLVVNILLVPSILAIVFGLRGRAASAVAGGRGLATAGLVMGIVGIVGSAISFFVNLVSLSGFSG